MKLQFITAGSDARAHIASAKLALEGGVRWVQVRVKAATFENYCDVAAQVKELCLSYNAVLIVNDRVDVAREVGAHGVHLGSADECPEKVRAEYGNSLIVGGTANSFEDVRRLSAAGVDYVGLGPYRYTTTKKNLSPVLGLLGVKAIMSSVQKTSLRSPVIVIGGIRLGDVSTILGVGGSGVAVSGAIRKAKCPTRLAAEFVKQFERGGKIENGYA